MIIGIEGTGSQSWGQSDLQRSFVRRILHQSKISPKYYFIGPGDSGWDGRDITVPASTKIKKSTKNSVTMVGYSRGAAYSMFIASCLTSEMPNLEVTLVLFDAVARQHDMNIPEKIPSNVTQCFHAMRDPRSGSRHFMSNVGKHVSNTKTRFEKKLFMGSHGSLGGVSWDAAAGESGNTFGSWVMKPDDRQLLNVPDQPITNAAQDAAVSDSVARWMWPFLIKVGIIPSGTNALAKAPPFEGSRQAGVANRVK